MARAFAVLGAIAMDRGDRQTAASGIREARTLSRVVEDPAEAARLVADITMASMAILDADESRELATELLELGKAAGNRHAEAQGTGCLGLVAQMTGDIDDAIAKLSDCARMLAEVGTMPGQAWALSSVGIAHAQRGDLETARPLLREGAARARDLDWVFIGLTALEGAASWLGAAGDAQRAVVCWAAVDAIRSTTLDRTFGHDAGLFVTSRSRDRVALRPADFDIGRAEGDAMSLREALDYAIRALDETVVAAIPVPASAQHGRYDLTRREREVLNQLAAGRSDSQIAEALFISKKTASVHVANIKGKLGVGSRVEIVTTAFRLGLAKAPD
jgi:ATP/maltotriose-dependent transcriptional regulator MalT